MLMKTSPFKVTKQKLSPEAAAKKKKRDKTMGISLIVAIFAILIFAYVISSQYGQEYEKFEGDLSNDEEKLKSEWNDCIIGNVEKGFNIEYAEDVCYLNTLGLSVESKDCEKIVSPDLKDYCYVRISARDMDVSVCSKVSSTRFVNCYLAVALKKEDISICEQLSSFGDLEFCKGKFEELK